MLRCLPRNHDAPEGAASPFRQQSPKSITGSLLSEGVVNEGLELQLLSLLVRDELWRTQHTKVLYVSSTRQGSQHAAWSRRSPKPYQRGGHTALKVLQAVGGFSLTTNS